METVNRQSQNESGRKSSKSSILEARYDDIKERTVEWELGVYVLSLCNLY